MIKSSMCSKMVRVFIEMTISYIKALLTVNQNYLDIIWFFFSPYMHLSTDTPNRCYKIKCSFNFSPIVDKYVIFLKFL